MDVFAANQAEFICLKDEREIRLDRIVSVNDKVARFKHKACLLRSFQYLPQKIEALSY